MNHNLFAASVAAVALAVAAPALASPAFDAFRTICGETHADLTAVKGAVASGWTPTDVAPSAMEGVIVDESLARATRIGAAKATLFAWHGTKGGVQVSACTLRISPTKQADLAAEAKAWLGFKPDSADSGKSVWRYTEGDKGRTAVDKAGYNAAAAAGGLDFFTVSAQGGDTVLDLLKIKS